MTNEQTWNSRETSLEIGTEIDKLATDERDASAVWAAPTDDEQRIVLERAFASCDDDELNWGCETFTR